MKTVPTALRVLLWLPLCGICLLYPARLRAQPDPGRFAAQIEAFEQADRDRFPAKGGILFVGSSSFRMWKTLAEDMAPLPVINRGFGGSTFWDLLHYMDRIVLPYEPRIVVVYEGDNDLANGRTPPQTVVENFRTFAARVHAQRADTAIVFLSIKPSGRRIQQWPAMKRANDGIREIAAAEPLLHYVDISDTLLDADGTPIDDRFLNDRLHVTRDTYARWAEVLRPVLEKLWQEMRVTVPDQTD